MKNRACFFCNTPFQIMTALSIQLQEKYMADICIDPHFENGDYYKKKIKELGLFESIKIVQQDDAINKKIRYVNNGIKRKVNLILLYISNYGAKYLTNPGYDFLFTSTNAFLYSICSSYLNQKHKHHETIYFDDGEGSYDDFMKIADAFSGTTMTVYLYSPELFRLCYPDLNINAKQIIKWGENDETKAIIEHVFGQKDKARIDEKYIILDTIKSEVLSLKDTKELNEIYHEIAVLKNPQNVIIKKHPRDKIRDESLTNYTHTSIPFEYIALESNVENKVLISLASTAVIMPKIVLDQEPFVILLYKMFTLTIGEDETRERLYNNCRSLYRDRSRFIIPRNKEELMNVLYSI